MSKPIDIIEGHVRKVIASTPLASTEVEQLAATRLQLCHACITDGKKCLSDTSRCCKCGCDMEAKTRVKSMVCPIGKW